MLFNQHEVFESCNGRFKQESFTFPSMGSYKYYVRKIVDGWVGLQNAYNCLFSLCNLAHFCLILLIMWVGGLKNRGKRAYVIYVWSLMKKSTPCEVRSLSLSGGAIQYPHSGYFIVSL